MASSETIAAVELVKQDVVSALARLNAATCFYDMGDTSVDWLLALDNTDELKAVLDDCAALTDELLRDLGGAEPAWDAEATSAS